MDGRKGIGAESPKLYPKAGSIFCAGCVRSFFKRTIQEFYSQSCRKISDQKKIFDLFSDKNIKFIEDKAKYYLTKPLVIIGAFFGLLFGFLNIIFDYYLLNEIKREVYMKKIFLCALILLCAGMSYAETFNIDKVIQLGLENSYDITNQTYTLQKSKQSLYSSFLDILPNANYSISNTEPSSPTSKSGNISITETVSSDDYRYFNITGNLSSLRKSKIDLEITRKNLIYNIISSYLDVLLKEN